MNPVVLWSGFVFVLVLWFVLAVGISSRTVSILLSYLQMMNMIQVDEGSVCTSFLYVHAHTQAHVYTHTLLVVVACTYPCLLSLVSHKGTWRIHVCAHVCFIFAVDCLDP